MDRVSDVLTLDAARELSPATVADVASPPPPVADPGETRHPLPGDASPEARALLLSARHEGSDPEAILRAAIEHHSGRIALVSSFGAESAVLLHMVSKIDRTLPVVLLDTGKLFAQTMLYRAELVRLLGLTTLLSAKPNPVRLRAEDPDGLLSYSAPDLCCWIRKVEPLDEALAPFDAWITGRKRYQASTRGTLAPFEADGGRLKVNPLASWTSRDVTAYLDRHNLPQHPLLADGYASIGCAPCTTRVREGEDARAGRWRGRAKVECGIHVATPSHLPERSGSGI